jgi:hypothetical protein
MKADLILKIIVIFNRVLVLLIAALVCFLSITFFIGTEDDKIGLIRELPLSFIFRFCFFTAVGILAVGILVLTNYMLNKFIVKGGGGEVNLKHLARNGVLWMVLASLIGCIIFFFG